MAEIKLKDFVDEESFKKLVELDEKITSIKGTYTKAAEELAKGLTIEVRCKGDLDKLQNVYNTQMRNVSSASDSLTGALKKQSEVAEQLMKKIKEKTEAEKLSTKEVKELSKATVEASKAVQQAAKAEEAMNKAQRAANTTRKAATMTEEERIRTIKEALALADKQVHSIDEANEANKRLRQAVKMVRDTDEGYKDTLGKLNATIGVNTDYVKRNSDRYTQQKMNIGNYTESIKQAWMELNNLNDSMQNLGIMGGGFGSSLGALGDIGGIFESIKGYSSVFSNKWLLGLGAIGGGAALGYGWWVNYNKGLVEATRLTQQFTEKSGDDLKEYRTEVQTIADYYNKDFREVLIGANAVSKQFGIDASEAIKLIQDGFIAGADANGEFLDTLREYPAYFKEAGISAETFIAITAQAAKSGIYSDKGVDVIKEGNLRIREMTTATADALEGIGISATEVQEQLKSGQKTTFDIIQMVSERLNELPDSASVVGTALADIFGGPGEDAGLHYIRTLKDIKTNLNDLKADAGEVGEAQEEYLQAQKELATEVAKLFDATGGAYESMVAKVKTSIASMTSDLVKFVRQGIESIEERSEREESEARTDGEKSGVIDVQKQYDIINRAAEKYEADGLSREEAFKKAKEERLSILKKSLEYEEQNLKDAVTLNEKYYKEYQDASFWRQGVGLDRTNNEINADIKTSWDARMSAQRGYSSLSKQYELVGSYQDQSVNKKITGAETADEKTARLEAEKALQESRIALMDEGLDKELAVISNGYQQKIDAVKGNSSAEIALRKSLQEEMNKALSEATKKYEKERADTDLQNRLAIAEEGSEEELSIRLEILEKQKEAEIKAAESNGADISLIEQKYLNEKRKLYEEYAADEVEEIAKSAAAQQVVRNAMYNSEMKDMEKAFAAGLISREEYENKKAEITERFSIDTAKAAVSSLEEQLSVEELSADDREAIAEKLQKAKADLANAEADAEIAAIERIKDKEEETYRKRIKKAQEWLSISSDAIGTVGDLMSTLYENDIEDIEKQQEANEEAYNADVERIDALVENGVLSTEEGEARKRAAEAETAKKNEELENEKVKLQQKQAKWQKGVDIAQAGIATALAITRALPNLVLAAIVGAMGAIQVATIAATPIPAYKEGTKNGGHIGGLAIVGDGGKQEVIVYGGKGWVTPDTPTIVDLPRGAEVYPDINTFDDLNLSLNPINDDKGGPVIVNDYSELSREMKAVRSELKKMSRLQHKDAYNARFENYKRNRL
ncbi:phage tail tape measure protein [Bacteroides sp. ET336]|uniref:phage tail tape measure protein n=1 Tax=Bacteroides sp. ET336 TaxID=2972459 RepID=UPI0021ACF905|nr:phage tail tape measure protein [Bacteroides sp. ET336]MCR8892445.1 phage tail tape measure protein [Bacteroides sp. ET336]MDN0056941.1 phage tail tape measure protein [Bacteroides caecigallinarum]